MTFHDLLLVSNETTNLACFTVNTIFVCLFVYLFSVLFFLFDCLMEKENPSPFLSSDDSPPPTPATHSFFNVLVHINQGADQLNTKLSTRSKALKSALEEKTLKKCS